ncbi:hypothetical protein HDV00_012006 [Rhizophlyctis rosea]|nr:hypothetical protein HDV00_012006 [Rhizophlyctis rosea]
MAQGDLAKRDYVPAGVSGLDRSAYLNAFFSKDVEELKEAYKKTVLAAPTAQPITLSPSVSPTDTAAPFKLTCNLAPNVVSQLKDVPNVALVGQDDASIVWERDPLHLSAVEISKTIRYHVTALSVVLVMYLLMQRIKRSTYGGELPWFTETFSITNDLAVICGHYLQHQSTEKPLFWTVSPDPESPPVVSSNIAFVLRHRDLSVPGVVQRCIDNPLLYGNRKFALDFSVLVKASKGQSDVHLYQNFITRLARDEYDVQKLENGEVHYMIPRFDSSGKLSPDTATFVKNIAASLPGQNWEAVLTETRARIKDAFSALLASTSAEGKDWAAVYEVSVEFTRDGKPVIMDVQVDEHLVGLRAWEADFGDLVGALRGEEGRGFVRL